MNRGVALFGSLLLAAALLLVPGSGLADKPVIHMDSRGPAAVPSVAVLPLVEGWHHDTAVDNLNTVFRFEPSAPLIMRDRVFVASARTPSLQAHRLADGAWLARWDLDAPVIAPLLKVDDNSFVVADTEGKVQRRNLQGDILWEAPVSGGVLSPMHLSEETLYVVSAGNALQALRVSDGGERWAYVHQDRRPTSAPPPIFGGSAPMVWPGGVLAGFGDGSWVNIGPDDGLVRWTLVVSEGDFPDAVAGAVWLPDQEALVLSSYSGPVVAIEPKTKDELWRLDMGCLGTPLLVRDLLYLEDPAGNVRAVSAESGVEQWKYKLPSGPSGGLLRDGGTLFVSDRHDTLVALDRFTGKRKWHWHPFFKVSGIWHPPTTDGVWYVVHTNEGRIQAFHRPWGPQDLRDSQSERAKRSIGG